MAKRTFTVLTFTPVAVGDGSGFTDAQHMSMQGGSTTQISYLTEVFLGGQAAAGAPAIVQLAYHSTIGATITALAGPNSDSANSPATAALGAPVKSFVASTTKPQADAANKKGNYSFNAFGGLIRRQWDDFKGPMIIGNAVPATGIAGEIGLNGYTGSSASALMGGHIEYETV
jgi:hypothetical protein